MSRSYQLISDGNQFYEAPLLSTRPPYLEPSPHSAVNIEMHPAPASSLISTPTMPMASAGAGAANSPASLRSSSASSASSAANTKFVAPQTALSDEAARVQIEAYIRVSVWFQLHEIETRVDAVGVPACALQLAQPGHSIWACFFKRVRRNGTSVFKCIACGIRATECIGPSAINVQNGDINLSIAWIQGGEYSAASTFVIHLY